MSKVYVVMEFYFTDMDLDLDKDTPVRAFGTFVEAEEFIHSMPIVPIKELECELRSKVPCNGEELEKKENGCWRRPGEETEEVLWDLEGVIRAFVFRDTYGDDHVYAYYISEIPFGKEAQDG